MSDFNAEKNRIVWCDIPVADLDRACAFYAAVLGIDVPKEAFEGFEFAVLAHDDGNGGCLVPMPDQIASGEAGGGLMVYFNVDGRIRDAVARVAELGGAVLQDVHAIGPHGFRAIVHDSEGNRLALHSESDA